MPSDDKTQRIQSYHVVIIIMVILMFSRTLTVMGFTSLLNFLHFPLVLFGFLITMMSTAICYKKLNRFVLIVGWLLLVITFSALVNEAGLLNVILDFILLAEPFLFLILITSSPWSKAGIKALRKSLLIIVGIHIAMSYFQFLILGARADYVQGLFLNMIAGCHVSGAIALTMISYLVIKRMSTSRIVLIPSIALLGGLIIVTDSKQVIVSSLIALGTMLLLKVRHTRKFLQYFLLCSISAMLVFLIASSALPALKIWSKSGLIWPGLQQKISVFPLIQGYYTSWLHWLIGLGPGHTIGRLGWLIPKYSQYLTPLGITTSPISEAVLSANRSHWLSNPITGSSVFALSFSWAGIWGDLGLIGLGFYGYFWYDIWKRRCVDDMTKFLILTTLFFGVIFAWLEEPNYMLFVMSIIGLRWQEQQQQKHQKIYRTILGNYGSTG